MTDIILRLAYMVTEINTNFCAEFIILIFYMFI